MSQLDLLWDYQQADVEVDNIKRDIARSPQRLKLLKLRDSIKEQQAFLVTLENELAAMLDRLDVLKEVVEMKSEQLDQVQEKVNSRPATDAKTAREYVAETTKLLNELNEYDAEAKRIKRDAQEREKRQHDIRRMAVKIKMEFDALRDEYNVEYEEKSRKLEELKALAEEKAKLVEPEWMEKYNRVKQHSVPPIAKLVNDRCSGCNMGFPSSDLTAIKAGKDVECETCGRMIIV